MKKSLFMLLLVFTFVFSCVSIAQAATENSDSPVQVSQETIILDNGTQILVTEEKSTLLLEEKVTRNGNSVKNYVATTRASYSISGEDYSSNGFCQFGITLYYSTTTINGRPLVYITECEVWVDEPSPSSMSVYDAEVSFGQSGIGIGGYQSFSTFDSVYGYNEVYSDGGSAVRYPDSDWEPVADNDTSVVGSYFDVTFHFATSGEIWTDTIDAIVY